MVYGGNCNMEKKQQVVSYLLEVVGYMEQERGRRINYTEFGKISEIPWKTVRALFDPDDPRLPSTHNANKIAVLTGSNRINEILGYESLQTAERYLRIHVKLMRKVLFDETL